MHHLFSCMNEIVIICSPRHVVQTHMTNLFKVNYLFEFKTFTAQRKIVIYCFFLWRFRAHKDSEIALDAQKYVALVRVLSKHGMLEG